MIRKILGYINDGSMRSILLRGSGASFFVKATGAFLALALQTVLARVLGVESFGEYTYIYTWMVFVAIFGRLGLDTASLRFIHEYQVEKEWGLLKGFLAWASQVTVGCSITLTLAGAVLLYFIRGYIGSDLTASFLVGMLILTLVAWQQIFSFYLMALKHIIAALSPLVIGRPLLLISAVLIITGSGYKLSVRGMLGIEVVVTLLALVLTRYLFIRASTFIPHAKDIVSTYQARFWFKTSFPMLLVSGAQMTLLKMDIIMIGFFLTTKDAGKYAFASIIAGLVTFFIHAANSIISPLIAELYAKKKMLELQDLITSS